MNINKITLLIIALLGIGVFSCENRVDDVEPFPPAIRFLGGGTLGLSERGTTFVINAIIRAPAGISFFRARGEFYDFNTSSTVDTIAVSVPVPANQENPIVVPFELTDNTGRVTTSEFTIALKINVLTDITSNFTFQAANTYVLKGPIRVTNATLTIESGTKILAGNLDTKANTAVDKLVAALIIDPTGKIVAEGTAQKPIVFSSEKTAGLAGDWQGIEIIGTGAALDQGILKYVRIEFGGNDVAATSARRAALRLNRVTNPTVIDYVQIFKSGDAGVEARGGNVHLSHIITTDCSSFGYNLRGFSTVADGYDGTAQFIIGQSRLTFKTDGTGTTNPTGVAREIETRDSARVTIANVTLLGPTSGTLINPAATPPSQSEYGAVRVRSTTSRFLLHNSIMAEYPDDGIRMDVPAAKITKGWTVLRNSYVFRIFDLPTRDGNSVPLTFETNAATYNNIINKTTVPAAAAGIGVDDYTPNASIASTFNPSTLGGKFVDAPFVGAIGTVDWTIGWALNTAGTVR
jgi:hypothetical protein